MTRSYFSRSGTCSTEWAMEQFACVSKKQWLNDRCSTSSSPFQFPLAWSRPKMTVITTFCILQLQWLNLHARIYLLWLEQDSSISGFQNLCSRRIGMEVWRCAPSSLIPERKHERLYGNISSMESMLINPRIWITLMKLEQITKHKEQRNVWGEVFRTDLGTTA